MSVYDEYGFLHLCTEEQDFRDWNDVKSKILHLYNYLDQFMDRCKRFPDFVLLFIHEDDICMVHRPRTNKQELMFHVTDVTCHLKAFDMTELTGIDSSEPFLQFQ